MDKIINNHLEEMKLERHGYVPKVLTFKDFASISFFSGPHVFTQILCENDLIFKERFEKMISSFDSKN